MSISAELRSSARSAYRALYRASSSTFTGDAPVLKAFREKMREDAHNARQEADPVAYQRYAEHALDIATFLRRNVARATKVEGPEDGLWKLHLTEHTEIGDNDSIKSPPDVKSSRSSRKQQRSQSEPVAQPEQSLHFSALKRAHKTRTVPILKEQDIEESFVRGVFANDSLSISLGIGDQSLEFELGSGPGGQSVNKTENNVQLLHKPTGIRVSCQETRSLSQNRKLARQLLVAKLDQLQNPGLSKDEFNRARERERARQRRKKRKKEKMNVVREEKKKAWNGYAPETEELMWKDKVERWEQKKQAQWEEKMNARKNRDAKTARTE